MCNFFITKKGICKTNLINCIKSKKKTVYLEVNQQSMSEYLQTYSIAYTYSCILQQQVLSMQKESNSHNLDYQYRDYLENGNSIPQGTKIGDYKVIKEIGKGAFGKIFLAQNSNNQNFALKLMDLEQLRQEPNPKIKQIRQRLVKNQPSLMQQCNSPNVLKCYQIFESQSLKLLVLQYCNGKTLQQYLDEKHKIKQDEAVKILRQIINGIAELHNHSIIHRDLKADNIMEHEGEYKIIDLGFSKKLAISNELAQVKGTILGTVTTMAPQVLSKQSYGLKADIWSIGVIFFQMVFGTMLYDTVSARQRLKEIEQKKYFSPNKELSYSGVTISKEANNFLYKVLQVNTDKRIGWRELLQHPLIAKKQQEPLGQRFLIDRDLEEPQIDLNFQMPKPQELSIGLIIQDQQMKKVNQDKQQENKKLKIDVKYNKDVNQVQQSGDLNQQKKDLPKKLARFNKEKPQIQDSAEYKWVKLGHLECLKTELVYNQIIIPIENAKLLNLQERAVIEFIFLMSARCFNNMSPISHKIQTQKNKQNVLVKNLQGQTKILYKKVLQKFQFYSDKLTKVENNFYQIFLDFFRKRFLKKNYEQKSSYTSGIQCVELDAQLKKVKKSDVEQQYGDYSKKQQIDYTYKNYVTNMLLKISNTPIASKVSAYLRYYDKIMNITLAQLQGETFPDYVKRIVQ